MQLYKHHQQFCIQLFKNFIIKFLLEEFQAALEVLQLLLFALEGKKRTILINVAGSVHSVYFWFQTQMNSKHCFIKSIQC